MDSVLREDFHASKLMGDAPTEADEKTNHSHFPELQLGFPTPGLNALFDRITSGTKDSAVNRVSLEIEEPRVKNAGAKDLGPARDLGPSIDKANGAISQTRVKDSAGYWQKSGESWQAFDGAGRTRPNNIDAAGVIKVESLSNGNVRIQLKDGSCAVQTGDGALVRSDSNGKLAEINYPDGSKRKFDWDGNQLKSMTAPDGKLAERVQTDGKYVDQWRLQDGTVWSGKIEADANKGSCKIAAVSAADNAITIIANSDGSKTEMRKDQSSSVKFANGDHVDFDSAKHPTALVTADGVKREFSQWSIDMTTGKEQPGCVKITQPNASTSAEWTFKNNQWQSATDSGLYTFNVDAKSGKYSFRDNDSGELKCIMPGKFKEGSLEFGKDEFSRRELPGNKSTLSKADGSFTVEIEGTRTTKISDHRQDRFVSYNSKGQPTELRDTATNTTWKQNEKNEWSASALDASLPFAKPELEPGKARLVVDSMGLCAFIDEKGGMKKLSMNSRLAEMSASESLQVRMNASDNMQPEGKQRVSESIGMFNSRTDISEAEKKTAIDEMQKLVSSSESSSYSQANREVIAAQALWHMARPNRQEQGQHPTCNVTTVRSALMHESPADFARMMAEIGTTDKFKTSDGNFINVPSSMVAAAGAELQFPPAGGNRSWVSQISDVAMANVYWQRRTVDTYGQAVHKGSLQYNEITPQYKGDNGERLYCYGADGKVSYELRERGQNTLARTPELYPADILEVMSQITGKSEKGRVIANKNQYPDHGAGVAVVESQSEFDKEMSHGPWPKIVAVHTSRDPFWQDSGFGVAGGAGGRTGGWHVVVATAFDPKTGRVAVDNSWQPERDHNSPSKQIPAKTLYESTIGPQS